MRRALRKFAAVAQSLRGSTKRCILQHPARFAEICGNIRQFAAFCGAACGEIKIPEMPGGEKAPSAFGPSAFGPPALALSPQPPQPLRPPSLATEDVRAVESHFRYERYVFKTNFRYEGRAFKNNFRC